MENWLALFCSSAGFTGFLPGWLTRGRVRWGGVMGSLVGLVLQVYCMRYADGWYAAAWYWQIVMIFATLYLGGMTIAPAELFMFARWGPRRRHTGAMVNHDFNETCIDEVHGQLIAGLPVYLFADSTMQIVALALSFLLFRFFDVMKIGPVKWAEEKLPGAMGIMLDDTFAGLMAAAGVLALTHLS